MFGHMLRCLCLMPPASVLAATSRKPPALASPDSVCHEFSLTINVMTICLPVLGDILVYTISPCQLLLVSSAWERLWPLQTSIKHTRRQKRQSYSGPVVEQPFRLGWGFPIQTSYHLSPFYMLSSDRLGCAACFTTAFHRHPTGVTPHSSVLEAELPWLGQGGQTTDGILHALQPKGWGSPHGRSEARRVCEAEDLDGLRGGGASVWAVACGCLERCAFCRKEEPLQE